MSSAETIALSRRLSRRDRVIRSMKHRMEAQKRSHRRRKPTFFLQRVGKTKQIIHAVDMMQPSTPQCTFEGMFPFSGPSTLNNLVWAVWCQGVMLLDHLVPQAAPSPDPVLPEPRENVFPSPHLRR